MNRLKKWLNNSGIKRHIQYAKYVIRHKYFVYREGRKMGLPRLMLFIHDWDKFLPDEWFPYARFFYNSDGSKTTARNQQQKTGYYQVSDIDNPEFELAWLKHQHRNAHHWQHWTRLGDDGTLIALPMPYIYRQEMIADWRGAGMAQGFPNTWEWWERNQDNMTLNEATREQVQTAMLIQKYISDHAQKRRLAEHA